MKTINPEFFITDKNWDKVINYARSAYDKLKAEIGGMAVMVEDELGDWHLHDPEIMKQEVSSGNCHLMKEHLADYYTRAAMKWKDSNFRFCWWHSHHTMDAFWSGTDKTAIEEYSDGDFSFALVVNLNGDYKFRVSMWKPLHKEEDVELIKVHTKKIPKKIEEEVLNMCEAETTSISKWKRPANQVSMFGTSEIQRVKSSMSAYNEVNSWNDSFTPRTNNAYDDAVDMIDKLNGKLISGEITYLDYVKSIAEFNQYSEVKLLITKEVELANKIHDPAVMFIDYETDTNIGDYFV